MMYVPNNDKKESKPYELVMGIFIVFIAILSHDELVSYGINKIKQSHML